MSRKHLRRAQNVGSRYYNKSKTILKHYILNTQTIEKESTMLEYLNLKRLTVHFPKMLILVHPAPKKTALLKYIMTLNSPWV